MAKNMKNLRMSLSGVRKLILVFIRKLHNSPEFTLIT